MFSFRRSGVNLKVAGRGGGSDDEMTKCLKWQGVCVSVLCVAYYRATFRFFGKRLVAHLGPLPDVSIYRNGVLQGLHPIDIWDKDCPINIRF